MSILSGFFKTKRYRKTADGYKLESNWTSGNTVELDDGNTVQNNVGAIKGITTSTSVTEEGYAADATTVAALNNSLSDVNNNLKWLNIWKSHSLPLPNGSNGSCWAEQYGKLLKLNFYGKLGPAGMNNSYPIVEFSFKCQTNEYGIAFSQNTGNAFLLKVEMNDNKLYIDTKNEELDGGYYFGNIVFFIE